MSINTKILSFLGAVIAAVCITTSPTLAQSGLEQAFGGLPALTVSDNSNGTATYSLSLQILMLMTALTVLPSLVLGMTSFTRVIIVLSLLRQAMGTQQTPPNQVLIAIAMFLTFFHHGTDLHGDLR